MESLTHPFWSRRCAAVIPCYNEATSIAGVVAATRKHLPGVIVVDDGSTDATARNAREAGAELVRLTANAGKGAALRAGWERALEQGFEWVLLLDGDGQHATEDIPGFFATAEATTARLVVGNRMGNPGDMPWLRRWANCWMSRRISRLTGRPLPDSQCGFRLVHLATLGGLSLTARRFEIESEMLVEFLAAGHRVEFVRVRTIYLARTSKIRVGPDTWRWLRWRWAQPAGPKWAHPENP